MGSPAVVPTPQKLQGYKSQFKYGTPAVQMKSLSEYTVDIKADVIEASDHDTGSWKSKMTGMLTWTASVKGVFLDGEATQANLLAALVAGNAVNCEFFPQIAAAGSGYSSYQGLGSITGFSLGAKMNDVQTVDITIEGFGPLALVAQ